jgi:hypothetical protein
MMTVDATGIKEEGTGAVKVADPTGSPEPTMKTSKNR